VRKSRAADPATSFSFFCCTTINIDAGALTGRDGSGKLQIDETRYPHGLRWLSDRLHAMDFKFGVYTDISGKTCGNGPGTGSLGHYDLDAHTFAHEWQADYLKVDFCGPAGFAPNCANASDPRCISIDPEPQYAAWAALRDALNRTGRPIYFSICPHAASDRKGTGAPFNLIYAPPLAWNKAQRRDLANSLLVEYDNTMDSWADFTDAKGYHHWGVLSNIDSQIHSSRLQDTGPSSWNDADMLQVCNYGEGYTPGGGMSLSEYRVHYTVWAILYLGIAVCL
jgi:alpha-galactosidase